LIKEAAILSSVIQHTKDTCSSSRHQEEEKNSFFGGNKWEVRDDDGNMLKKLVDNASENNQSCEVYIGRWVVR